MEHQVILSAKELSKSFPGVKALQNISIDFRVGEVHALMGENGAGKSTLMNVLFGVFEPDEGFIKINNKEVHFSAPTNAMEHGISMIHQENSLIPHMSVMENVFLGHAPRKGLMIDKKKLRQQTEALMQEMEISDINPSRKAIYYSVAQKQLIEILKALSLKPRVLMMDEPTAALTSKETEILMKVIQRLKSVGTCIIYVSHRLEEVMRIADRITVLRDGQFISTSLVSETSQDRIISEMVGRDLSNQLECLTHYEPHFDRSNVVLEVRELSSQHHFENVSFKLYKGEILGFGGLVGAGRTELMESIFGVEPYSSGEIYLYGKRVVIRHPKDAIKKRVGLDSEERKVKGLFLKLSVRENINIPNYRNLLRKNGTISRKKEYQVAQDSVRELNIKTTSVNKKIIDLSGGNQQKAIIARWLNMHPSILILDEPTHGIDVGAKAEIYGLIRNLAKQGISIILISSEMPELLMLSDRVAVMHNGRINGILERKDLTQERIMNLAVIKSI